MKSTNATTETKSTGAMTESTTDVFDDILTQLKPFRFVEIPMMINKEIKIMIHIRTPLNDGDAIKLSIYERGP